MAGGGSDPWLRERLDSLHKDIVSLRHEIRGNGNPGLSGRLAKIEGLLYDDESTKVPGLVSRTDTLESEKRLRRWADLEYKWLLRFLAVFLLAREVGLSPGTVISNLFGW